MMAKWPKEEVCLDIGMLLTNQEVDARTAAVESTIKARQDRMRIRQARMRSGQATMRLSQATLRLRQVTLRLKQARMTLKQATMGCEIRAGYNEIKAGDKEVKAGYNYVLQQTNLAEEGGEDSGGEGAVSPDGAAVHDAGPEPLVGREAVLLDQADRPICVGRSRHPEEVQGHCLKCSTRQPHRTTQPPLAVQAFTFHQSLLTGKPLPYLRSVTLNRRTVTSSYISHF